MTQSVKITRENDTPPPALAKASASEIVAPVSKNSYLDGKLIEEQLGAHFEQDNSIKSVSKELFNSDKIDVKTELSHDEINMVTKLRFLERRFQLENVDVLIDSLLTLRVSMNRKSRTEFIQALRSEDQDAQNAGFLKRFLGTNK